MNLTLGCKTSWIYFSFPVCDVGARRRGVGCRARGSRGGGVGRDVGWDAGSGSAVLIWISLLGWVEGLGGGGVTGVDVTAGITAGILVS